jgi:hypothetical protein
VATEQPGWSAKISPMTRRWQPTARVVADSLGQGGNLAQHDRSALAPFHAGRAQHLSGLLTQLCQLAGLVVAT